MGDYKVKREYDKKKMNTIWTLTYGHIHTRLQVHIHMHINTDTHVQKRKRNKPKTSENVHEVRFFNLI